ncbi:MAG: FkbM family methyltransferase, partial [Nitrospinae bacterium]|nr:FkbM family methyltransferase [Nitrospinota bacterium]
MSKFKKRLNKIKKIELLIKRITYPLFHSTHPLFRKKDYFLNLFKEKAYEYNIAALNFDEGVVMGSFQGKDYLMHCQPGNLVETTIYLEKVWEEHLAKIMSLYLDGSTGIMIDVGANIGANTIPLAVKHPQIKFHCYEPHPEIFARLKSNIKLNNLKNVEPANSAVSNSSEKSLKFFAQKTADNMGRSSLKLNSDIKEHDEITVSAISIDDNFADNSDPVILIKVDTQGTELEVLQSATRTIEKFKPVILFELEDRYFSDSERVSAKKTLKEFYNNLDYSLVNVSKGLDYYPQVDIT